MSDFRCCFWGTSDIPNKIVNHNGKKVQVKEKKRKTWRILRGKKRRRFIISLLSTKKLLLVKGKKQNSKSTIIEALVFLIYDMIKKGPNSKSNFDKYPVIVCAI